MTEIERKALALLRECAEVPAYVNLQAIPGFVRAALFRAIEQHEALEAENERLREVLRDVTPPAYFGESEQAKAWWAKARAALEARHD